MYCLYRTPVCYNVNNMKPEERMKSVQRSLTIFVFVVIAFGGGFYAGKTQGTTNLQEKADELTRIIQVVYPPPPDVIHTMSGTVTDRYGAVLTIEFDSPEDYLPHLDDSPRATETRQVTIGAATKVQTIDYGTLDQYGSPTVSDADASAAVKGAAVRFTTDANIREAEEFTASSVDVILQ